MCIFATEFFHSSFPPSFVFIVKFCRRYYKRTISLFRVYDIANLLACMPYEIFSKSKKCLLLLHNNIMILTLHHFFKNPQNFIYEKLNCHRFIKWKWRLRWVGSWTIKFIKIAVKLVFIHRFFILILIAFTFYISLSLMCNLSI